MNMQPTFAGTMISLAIIVGSIECFFGYRIFKITLGVTGFLCGAVMAMYAGNAIFNNEIIRLLISIMGGVAGAVIMVWLYFFGVFFTGAFMGAVMWHAFFSAFQMYPHPIIVIAISIACGLLALVFQKLIIILSTASIGSVYMATGIICFWSGKACLKNFDCFLSAFRSHYFIMMLMWLLFGVLGVLVQYNLVWEKDGIRKRSG